MAIDLNALEPAARERLLRVGRQYGSRDTLAQAEQTLTALGAHAAVLTAHGFNASDAAMLAEARQLLEQAGVGREDARSSKKETNLAFITALRAAKAKRARARSILSAVADVLCASVADGPGEDRARATLAQTRAAGDDAESLANQLDQLRGALSDESLQATAADRGGPAAVADLAAAAS